MHRMASFQQYVMSVLATNIATFWRVGLIFDFHGIVNA